MNALRESLEYAPRYNVIKIMATVVQGFNAKIVCLAQILAYQN